VNDSNTSWVKNGCHCSLVDNFMKWQPEVEGLTPVILNPGMTRASEDYTYWHTGADRNREFADSTVRRCTWS